MKRTAAILLFFSVLLLAFAGGWARPSADGREYSALGRLPVLMNGRVKPLDTVARTNLLMLSGKQGRKPPIEWLAQVIFDPTEADKRQIFLIDNPELLELLGLNFSERKRFSFSELSLSVAQIEKQALDAKGIEAAARSPYQRASIQLYERMMLYFQLRQTVWIAPPMASPPTDRLKEMVQGGQLPPRDATFVRELYTSLDKLALLRIVPNQGTYVTMGGALSIGSEKNAVPQAAIEYLRAMSAYQARDAAGFNHSIQQLHAFAPGAGKVRLEVAFNAVQPFYRGLLLYLAGFLVLCISWLRWPKQLQQFALALIVTAFLVHTLGLICRMVLQGRPPVTNLYSSAVFVGWGIAFLGLLAERFFRDGLGTLCAAVAGFVTLLIAQHLSVDGDTLEMLQAVLDSNFWLATHVVVITLGYSATFLAGLLGLIYIIRTRLPGAEPAFGKSIAKMAYGILCFALLFSFVGTVLGGIWADQSWGRFWGWDPKENGALLIVLWNAVILHARLGGLIREHGLLLCSVFGNVVTSFSWFGVNMLGVGLHSYGFMDEAFTWLAGFMISQLVFVGIGLLPKWAPRRNQMVEPSSAISSVVSFSD